MSSHRSLAQKISTKYILADYQKWKGVWVHWSSFPVLKINPQQFHQDPAGIYLFPEKFKTAGSWHAKQYKFIVEVPHNLNVLDLSTFTKPDTVFKLLEDMKATPIDDNFTKNIRESEEPQDVGWEWLQRFFMGKPGLFNKRLRQLGYDAVFDDTGSIHSSEVQLLLLDPRKVQNVKRLEQKGTGYDVIKQIVEFAAAEAKQYGEVEVKQPKKQFSGWDKENQIDAQVRVESGKDDSRRYATIEMIASPDISLTQRKFKDMEERKKTNLPAQQYVVRLKYSRPKLEGAPVKTYYKAAARDVNMDEIKDMITKLFKYIFKEKELNGPAAD